MPREYDQRNDFHRKDEDDVEHVIDLPERTVLSTIGSSLSSAIPIGSTAPEPTVNDAPPPEPVGTIDGSSVPPITVEQAPPPVPVEPAP